MENIARLSEERATVNLTELIQRAIEEERERARKAVAVVKVVDVPKKSGKARLQIEEIPTGEALTWNTTAEEIALINIGDRGSLDRFFFDEENYKHLQAAARNYMYKNAYLKSVIDYEDLIQQIYVDLLCGLVKLRPWRTGINGAIYHSFRYAAVGGADEVYIPKDYKKGGAGKCQRRTN